MRDEPTNRPLIPLDTAMSFYQVARRMTGPVPAPGRPVFNELVQELVQRPGATTTTSLTLEKGTVAAVQFDVLLRASRVLFGPKVAAAGSADVLESRQGDGFELKLRPSRADASQVHLVLSVDASQAIPAAQPLRLFVRRADQVEIADFPALHDGQTRIFALEGDRILDLLRDPDSDVSILNRSA